jgi:Fe-Mn family superoxide dismutase
MAAMHTYEAKTFKLPPLDGISDELVKQHIGLYEGYVKNFNAMTTQVGEYMQDREKNAHAIAELVRRRSFEFGGMRLHEYYFPQFGGGSAALTANGAFARAVADCFGSVERAITDIHQIAMMRGPGWSILYFDPEGKTFHIGFSGEQHQGHFVTLPIILALDVWEHAYILDYGAAGRAKYIDAFFKNLNWGVVEKRFAVLQA